MEPPLDPDRKLPVWRTAVGAYAFLFRNWREALRIGWLPFVAVVALDFLRDYLPSGDGLPTIVLAFYGFAVWAAYTPIVAMAVVPWHRFILLNQRARGGVFAVSLSAREGRYVVLTVAIMAIVTGINWAVPLFSFFLGWFSWAGITLGALFNAAGFVLYLAAVVASLYVFAILGLALPAVAVDRDGWLKGAVRLGYRNGWRLVLVTLAMLAPYYAYYWVAINLPDAAFDESWEFVWILVNGVFYVFEAFIAATALSLCYRALGGLRGSEPGPTVIPPSIEA
jgi:hypothetical protein